MGDQINLPFVHDSLPVFATGPALNRWVHQLASIGNNAMLPSKTETGY